MKNIKRIIYLAIGPVLLALCCLLIPSSFFDLPSKAAIGTVLWMAFWWITAPVDYAVTGLLPIAVNAIINMSPMSAVISSYASESIILLLGASIISAAWEVVGLDKRIASFFLRMIGEKVRAQVAFWFILAAVMSSILPNAVVCATIIPIAVAMLKYVSKTEIGEDKISSKILTACVYGACIGGMTSPLGGSMNLVTVEYIEQLKDIKEYSYVSWVIRLMPIVVVLVVINILFLNRNVKKSDTLGGSKEFFKKEYEKFPPMSFEEKVVFILFVVATALAFTRDLYKSFLPELKPAYIFIFFAIVSFVISNKGKKIVNWKLVQPKIGWEMMLIFAGGLAAGKLMENSGATDTLGKLFSGAQLSGGIITIILIILVSTILSNVTSNTATAAIAIPIVIAIMSGAGKDPLPYVYIATVGVNMAYILPTSIRAIPVGYGLKPKFLLKEGWQLTLISVAVSAIICYLFLRFWPAFGEL